MKFETHTLKNGMKVLLAPNKNAQSVTVMAMTGTGSRYESKKENGMAHFLEHMVFKGTKKRKSAQIIAEEIDGVGGTFNAFTSKDHTAYYAKVGKHHFNTAISVVSDIFLNPTFPENEIKREKGTIIEEINMYKDLPMREVLDYSDETLFGSDTPLGRTVLGPKENIRAFTRKDFVTYFNRNYIAENSAICITGAFSKAKALTQVRKLFKNMRSGEDPIHEQYKHTQTKAQVHLHYKKSDQTHLVLAVQSCALNDKNEVVAEVLAALLGGGMSSRMFTQVRERRGLAYYISSEQDSYDDTGSFYIRAGVANKTTKDALQVILKELTKIKKEKVKSIELKKVKEYIKGTTTLSLETTDAQAQYMGYSTLVRKRIRNFDEFAKEIDKVTSSEIQKLARTLFASNTLNLTIIGPHKDTDTFTRIMHI